MTERITFRQWLVWSLRIRRVEYRIAELPIFLMPVLLTAEDASAFTSAVFWEGLLVFFFLFALGDLVNCLADRDLDAKYKPHLSEAVYGLGVRGVAMQAVISGLAALTITLHLAWMLHRWVLVPMTIFGIALAWAYSAEPLRLKRRGLWQLAFYWLGLFAGPMIFAAALFVWPVPMDVVLFSLAFGLLQTGVILINTAEDFPEDRELGVRTVIVATGLRAGAWLAFALAVNGWVALLGIIGCIGLMRGASAAWIVLAGGPLLMAGAAVVVSLLRMANRIPVEESQAIARVKQSARLAPVWITAGALASLWACGVLFAVQ